MKGLKIKFQVVCNPVTREYITLPRVRENNTKSYFGYDPFNKPFSVLCVIKSYVGPASFRVLTLETGKRSWKKIECKQKIFIYCGQICISGVWYFPGWFEDSRGIICFDVRLDKFSFVQMDDEMKTEHRLPSGLFNYKGKLVAHKLNYIEDEVYLWVLEDAAKHKWSKCIRVQLPLWDKRFFSDYVIVAMVDTGEIVFSPRHLSNPFSVFYYNVERNSYTKVNIQGFEEFKQDLLLGRLILLHTSLNYVENLKFL